MLTQPGQIWQPGYWAWGTAGYYWVPGTWVTPPSAGLNWTPGYWGYNNGSYAWNNGYWAPQVGYYGGINYGYGYFGNGFNGGYWNNGVFSYNTAVMSVNPAIVRTTYVRRVIEPTVVTRYAFNGPNGVRVRPTVQELVVMREHHIAPTRVQIEHARVAALDRDLYARYNGGHPRVVAVERPVHSVQSLPHFSRVTTSTHAQAATERARAVERHADTARVRAQAAHEHANAVGTRAAQERAHAATVHANKVQARARTAEEKAHAARVKANHVSNPPADDKKKPPHG
jgi:hypothetical protein